MNCHRSHAPTTLRRAPHAASAARDCGISDSWPLQVETDILATGSVPVLHSTFPNETVVAATGGALRDLVRLKGFDLGLGADVTFYRVPPDLVATHGVHPVSFHVFLRLRPPARMGRMWNMTMTGLLLSHRRMTAMPGSRPDRVSRAASHESSSPGG